MISERTQLSLLDERAPKLNAPSPGYPAPSPTVQAPER